MRKSEAQKSRRKTPWDGESSLTPVQTFLKRNYNARYKNHHRKVGESGEADMVNSFIPDKCPFCSSDAFKMNGYTESGVQRYKCTCNKTFLPTTGTIFDEHKLSMFALVTNPPDDMLVKVELVVNLAFQNPKTL